MGDALATQYTSGFYNGLTADLTLEVPTPDRCPTHLPQRRFLRRSGTAAVSASASGRPSRDEAATTLPHQQRADHIAGGLDHDDRDDPRDGEWRRLCLVQGDRFGTSAAPLYGGSLVPEVGVRCRRDVFQGGVRLFHSGLSTCRTRDRDRYGDGCRRVPEGSTDATALRRSGHQAFPE